MQRVLFKAKNVISLLIILASVALYFSASFNLTSAPFSHDEVDYVVCAEKGIRHNAIGKQTLSLKEFVTLGKYKAEKDSTHIFEYSKLLADPNEDVFVLRHYHPPLPVYYWSFFNTQKIGNKEQGLRWSNFIVILLIGAVFFTTVFSKKLKLKFGLSALLVWALLLSSELFNYSFTSLNFHNFLGLFSIVCLYFLNHYISKPSFTRLVLLAVSCAFMLATLESALFVLALMVMALILTKAYKQFSLKSVFKLTLLTLLFTAVLWPAFFIKGEIIKSVGMYVSRIFVNDNLEYNEVSYLKNWFEVLKMAPFLFGFFLLTFVKTILYVNKHGNKKTMIPFIVGLGYCLLMTPFILNKTYIMPGVLILAFASAWSLQYIWLSVSNTYIPHAFAALSIILGFALKGEYYSVYHAKEASEFKKQLNIVEKLTLNGKVLVFPGHVFQYYISNENIDAIGHPKSSAYNFTYRYQYNRQNILPLIEQGKYQSIVLPNREQFNGWYKVLSEIGFDQHQEEDLMVFSYTKH